MKLAPHPVSTLSDQELLSQLLVRFWGDTIPQETARRVLGYWDEFRPDDLDDCSQYFKTFENDSDELVLVSNIPYQSLCEHHLLPFFGVAHIGYIPKGKVLGLSKFGRVLDHFSKRPQLQERLTCQLGSAIDKYLSPTGTVVILEGTHTCMSARGVLKQGAVTKTSYVSGAFKDDLNARQEVLQLLRGS